MDFFPFEILCLHLVSGFLFHYGRKFLFYGRLQFKKENTTLAKSLLESCFSMVSLLYGPRGQFRVVQCFNLKRRSWFLGSLFHNFAFLSTPIVSYRTTSVRAPPRLVRPPEQYEPLPKEQCNSTPMGVNLHSGNCFDFQCRDL